MTQGDVDAVQVETRAEFARKLAAARVRAGLTVRELAKRLGHHRGH